MCCALECQQAGQRKFFSRNNGIRIFSFFLWSVVSSLGDKRVALTGLERQMWKHLWCKVHLEGLYCIIPSFKAPGIRVLPWLFHGLKLDIAAVQAQSFTSPQSFGLPLNFSLGFENSFRIKLAVAMKLWRFNRNHQMTFKHDPVVQSCHNWFEVKKLCLQAVSLRKVTKCKWCLWTELMMVCLCFEKRKRSHLCQLLRWVSWNWFLSASKIWILI